MRDLPAALTVLDWRVSECLKCLESLVCKVKMRLCLSGFQISTARFVRRSPHTVGSASQLSHFLSLILPGYFACVHSNIGFSRLFLRPSLISSRF